MNEIKDKIIASINRAKDKGITLITDSWGDSDTKCTCALGCVIMDHNDGLLNNDAEENAMEAADILGVSEGWVTSFLYGFDGDPPHNSPDGEAWRLGRDIRYDLNPVSNSNYVDGLNLATVRAPS